jgi:predicted DCC family thiol-disulfide oxidoreductase YuxK
MESKAHGNSPVAILIFDGDCGFCTSTANFIVRRALGKIEAHPWQFVELAKFGLTTKAASAKVQLVSGGKNYAGHEAFVQIMQISGPPVLRQLSLIALVKPFSYAAGALYWLVARYRHKLPGGTPACKMPR